MTLTGHVPAPRPSAPLLHYPSQSVGGFPSAAGLLPSAPVPAAKSRRWLVIVIGAVLAVTLGVVLAFAV